MPKIIDEPLTSLQLRLYTKDLAKLRVLFSSNVGVNQAVRVIVRTYLRQAEAKAAKAIDAIEKPLDETELNNLLFPGESS
jgi:hypothetical protein